MPSFPPNSSIQFVGNATVHTCNASDSLSIRLTQPCGGIGKHLRRQPDGAAGCTAGRGALLTSNTQQATIPLCSAGDVRLIVKNASPQADLYNFFVQEALTDVTYVVDTAEVQLVRADGTASAFVPFTPTLVSPPSPLPPYRQTLQWDAAEMADYDPAVRALLARRGPSDQLFIQFKVRTYCAAPLAERAGCGSGRQCVHQRLPQQEFAARRGSGSADSRAAEAGAQCQRGGGYAASVFAGQGDTLGLEG